MPGEVTVQVFPAQVLNDAQIPEAIFLSRFNHGTFAKIIPGDYLDHGGVVGHASAERSTQNVPLPVPKIAPVVAHAGPLINVMEARKGAADKGRPGGCF